MLAGPDGALWINGRDHIYKMMATDGHIFEYPKSTGAGMITTGPHDDLWFTVEESGKIGRITTDGKRTEFALPNNFIPHAITMGADRAMWLTVDCIRAQPGYDPTGKIGRITA